MSHWLHWLFHSWGPWEEWDSTGLDFMGNIRPCRVRTRYCSICGDKQEEQVR